MSHPDQQQKQGLFPETKAYHSAYLAVSERHSLYYEESGNPQGQPVVFIHGGPGGGVIPKFRRFFDPEHYRIILFDQRGAGQSRPPADLNENTTWDLVADMEKLRNHLGIEQWLLFGGSWGSTLALTYAISHPAQVTGLILRGIFLCRPWEIHWLYQQGASHIFPDAYERYVSAIPAAERQDLVSAFHRRLVGDDPIERLKAAQAWSAWEASISKLIPDPNLVDQFEEDEFALAFARIEAHYFVNKGFYATDNWILENITKIRHKPGVIIHGRYDVVCALQNAWELHKAWPEAEFKITPDAGHSSMEAGTLQALITATEQFKQT